MVRVRFAPSPTGYLHIGGVRTALFNYLYARSQKGEFFVRIEDTDRERSKPEYEREIFEAMEWLGLKQDNAMFRQSERLAAYQKLAEEMVASGRAYREETEGKTAVKFKIPKTKLVFHDWVHGPIETDTALFEDLVILKSDGYPTYQWACVVDDHEMEITHVIRGDDHIPNTPKQILLFEAMGWKPPKYAHLPLILGNDGTPLSKRHGAVALTSFKQQGFLPEGILNYLALLGWSPSGNEEIFSLEALIKQFTLKRVNKANAKFDMEKLRWLNAQHLKKLSRDKYLSLISDFYPKESSQLPKDQWQRLCLLFQPRIRTFQDLQEQASYCFTEIQIEPEKAFSFFQEMPALPNLLSQWFHAMQEVCDFSNDQETEAKTRALAARAGVSAGKLIHPIRFALTGQTTSPGLFELMAVLGKSVCLERMRRFLEAAKGKGL